MTRDARAERRITWIARIGAVIVRLLGRTWRIRVSNDADLRRLRAAGQPIIFTLWHGEMLPLLYHHRGEGVAVLISEHGDGEIIARVAAGLGFHTVRGSTSRGAARALLALTRTLEAGRDLAITPDGPRGPAKSIAPGSAVDPQRPFPAEEAQEQTQIQRLKIQAHIEPFHHPKEQRVPFQEVKAGEPVESQRAVGRQQLRIGQRTGRGEAQIGEHRERQRHRQRERKIFRHQRRLALAEKMKRHRQGDDARRQCEITKGDDDVKPAAPRPDRIHERDDSECAPLRQARRQSSRAETCLEQCKKCRHRALMNGMPAHSPPERLAVR